MPSLEDNFSDLMQRIQAGRELGHAGVEPIYYLIFHPTEILEVKRRLPAWRARLKNDGWEVHEFSVAREIDAIFNQSPLMKLWLAADRKSPLAWEKTNQALANYLNKGALKDALETRLTETAGKPKAILLVTDLEALHPYTRIGAIESQLYGRFQSPTVFFYPGIRTGNTRLKFLGFYPEDGNYRSFHVGG